LDIPFKLVQTFQDVIELLFPDLFQVSFEGIYDLLRCIPQELSVAAVKARSKEKVEQAIA